MPTISEIPTAATLHTQLDALNLAIAALNAGSTVTNLTVSSPPAPPENPAAFTMPTMVVLNPPISDPVTVTTITNALQAQADAVTAQLVAGGYTDDLAH